MDKQLEDNINRFCNYFAGQVNQINAVSCGSADLFKKVLFCSLLDALSRSVYPRKDPRDRFTSVVRRFGKWQHQDRVSLPHLARLLQRIPDPSFEKLRKFTFDKVSQWSQLWNDVKLDQDPQLTEILQYLPKNDEHKTLPQKLRPESLTHLQLLYSHRNSLVHELRTPGYGIEMGTNEPFYHEVSTWKHQDEPPIETIELVYPVKFFELLCNTVLDGLNKYFVENRLNPYDSYTFGSYWIEELN